MLNQLAKKMARALVDDENVEKQAICIYGLELIISTVVSFISILIISMLMLDFLSGVVFIFIFAPLRLYVGGYHAKTYRKCFFVTNVSYLFLLILKDLCWNDIPLYIWKILVLAIVIFIGISPPLVSEEQPISKEKKKKSNGYARCILLIDLIIIIILSSIDIELMVMAILSMCLVFIFWIIGQCISYYHYELKEGI